MDTTRPYLISEFGPDGYWETRPTQRNARGALIEPDSDEKVQSYARAWAVHTEAHRGANIGGVAYCWRDRYEATATWFGLTDSDGRLKPAGLALQQLWTGRAASGPRVLALEGPNSPVAPGATINVRAQVRGKPGQHLTYKWRLASEDFDFKVGNVEGARITLPQRPGTYRVYFSASDGISMDEANFPVHVTTDTSSRMLVPPELLSTFSRRRVVGP
jgi:cellulose synthase (UDP-forming)